MRLVTRAEVRRTMTWALVAMGMAAATAYLVSFFVQVTLRLSKRDVAMGLGAVVIQWQRPPAVRGRSPGAAPPPGAISFAPPGDAQWLWQPRLKRPEPNWINSGPPQPGRLIIPLWIPLLIGAAAAYRLLPAGPPPGCCRRCRFDLAGAPVIEVRRDHVRCPECGTVSERETAAQEKPPARAGGSDPSH